MINPPFRVSLKTSLKTEGVEVTPKSWTVHPLLRSPEIAALDAIGPLALVSLPIAHIPPSIYSPKLRPILAKSLAPRSVVTKPLIPETDVILNTPILNSSRQYKVG